jgi:GcrA cell cycle regulator
MSETWTDERITEMTKWWNRGESAENIGRLLDVSRNAVAGKLWRLGLKRRNVSLASPVALPIVPAIIIEPKKPVPLLELKKHHCRYPLWGKDERAGEYCGKRRLSGSTYCAEHHKICRRSVAA